LGLSFPVKGVFEKEKQQLFEPLEEKNLVIQMTLVMIRLPSI
jgi:hypothetical protein